MNFVIDFAIITLEKVLALLSTESQSPILWLKYSVGRMEAFVLHPWTWPTYTHHLPLRTLRTRTHNY